MKYKVYNLFNDEYSQDLFLTDAKMLFQRLASEYLEPRLQVKNNIASKATFDDLLMAENYFRSFKGDENLTESQFIDFLNSTESADKWCSQNIYHAKYEQTSLILETGATQRYFSRQIDNKIYWVKVSNSVVTDLYEMLVSTNGWKQYNPTTKELQAYYELQNIDGVQVEKKFLANGSLDSECYAQGYDYLPNEFKTVLLNYPEFPKEKISWWSNKPYGKALTYTENLVPSQKASEVQDEVVLNRDIVLAEIRSRFTVTQTENNETWEVTDTTTWFE